MEHCGIDLHLKSSEVCVVDGGGAVSERARIPTTEKAFRRWFGGRERMRICIEASGLSPWVGRILVELGHEVIVANAQRVRLIAESTLKNDKVDAETLARLVRMDPGLLCPIRHRREETQRLRGMLRVRRTLVNSRTACLNTARGLLRSFGYRVPGQRPERLARALTTGKVPEELCGLVAPLVATARLRELLALVAVEVHRLRVKDLAERMRMNPGSASRVLARAAEREREDRTFHEQRLDLEERLAKLNASGPRSRR